MFPLRRLANAAHLVAIGMGFFWHAPRALGEERPSASASATPLPLTTPLSVTDKPAAGDFDLVAAGHAADLWVDHGDFRVVQIAAECLHADVERVTGVTPRLTNEPRSLSEHVVFIGTLGKSAIIDELTRAGKLDVKNIAGKWESFVIATVRDPLPGVKTGLVIAGNDRRGTAYGMFELSEAIGVSPWVWWADVTPRHRDAVTIRAGTHSEGPPSVNYRGIFINDEDWGFQPWAAKTFEPDAGDIGPKTYAKVCELLLRLKANYLWPAMHHCTKAFNIYPRNKLVADDYAIVMGSSHAEPMLRNNVSEWDQQTRGEWDYDKNRDGVLKYWEERVSENAPYKNVYTIGMRGIHDSAMPGGGTLPEKVARLQRVLEDQRALLARHVSPHVDQVPQVFVPYKEVLPLYENGLKVPDDVTLVWPDDNHGYIRHFSTPEEQTRGGGAGVYYHLSYWGAPEDYLWLCTTPPGLVWEEMSKAYDYGARTVWVVNVGDIKPAEIDLEFFLRMAWDIKPWDPASQTKFLADWSERTFGKETSAELGGILAEYYRLNYVAKPEHLLLADFSWTNYGEAAQRLDEFSRFVERVNALYAKIPPAQKDAFYELVVYPARCSALMNEKQINLAHSRMLAEQGEPDAAAAAAAKAEAAFDQIQAETRHYNEEVAGGKWNRIMSANPRKRPVFDKVKGTTASASPSPALASAPLSQQEPAAVKQAPPGFEGFMERDGCVSMDARHYTRSIERGGETWKIVEGLGRTGAAVTIFPTTAPSIRKVDNLALQAPVLEYDFLVENAGPATVRAFCVPTHATRPGGLHYAVAIDREAPKQVDIDTREFSKEWSVNVIRAAAIGTTEHTIDGPGKHTLRIWMVDPGLAIDKVVIDLGGVKPSQLGPPETRAPFLTGEQK